MSRKKVAIIGAGVSGLTAARYALLYGFQPTIFEKSSNIGGVWCYKEDLEIQCVPSNTIMQQSKELCAFSDFPIENYSTSKFLRNDQVLQYINAYASNFDLIQFIHFETEVTQVVRTSCWLESAEWRVDFVNKTQQSSFQLFDSVMVCTGMYSQPYRPPEYRMEKEFKGKISHSSNYKNCSSYHDKTVVVVGLGNSAISIACDIALTAKKVYLSTRRGAFLIDKVSKNGTPWDTSLNSQFCLIGRKIVPSLIRNVLWKKDAFKIQNPRNKLNDEFLSTHVTFENLLPLYLKNGKIEISSDLLSFTPTGVEFENKAVVDCVDEVIFCTGYTFDFPFIEEEKLIRVIYNDFHLYRQIFPLELAPHYNLGVIGHIRPIGSSLPIVEMQSRYFFHIISGNGKLPAEHKMKSILEQKRCNLSLNYVKSLRYTQIEDYVDYMNELATDIGCRPNFLKLFLHDPILAIACFIGPASAYQYRLEGPNKWVGARDAILKNENLHQLFSLKQLILFIICILMFSAFLQSIVSY